MNDIVKGTDFYVWPKGWGGRWVPPWREATAQDYEDMHLRLEGGEKRAKLMEEHMKGGRFRRRGSNGPGPDDQAGGIWPWGVHENEPVVWQPRDIAKVKDSLPMWEVYGPGKYAICTGQSGLTGANDRLIGQRENVFSLQEAALWCDSTPGCTHVSITMGPDWPFMPQPRQGYPFRADFCKGPKVSIDNVKGLNTFVLVRKGATGDLPPPDPPEAREFPDGPITPKANRDERYVNDPSMSMSSLPLPEAALLPGALLREAGEAGATDAVAAAAASCCSNTASCEDGATCQVCTRCGCHFKKRRRREATPIGLSSPGGVLDATSSGVQCRGCIVSTFL